LHAPQLTSEGRLLTGVLLAFVVVAVLAAVDLVTDLQAGTTFRHVLMEGAVVMVGLGGSAWVAQRLRDILRRANATQEEAQHLAARLVVSEADVARYRAEAKELLSGLGAVLDKQFERWELSPAEKEVALLLLKGLSHKEVAEARSITEATARQQARAVYKKAGLSGRNDLAAFFLEDLLLPSGDERKPRAPNDQGT